MINKNLFSKFKNFKYRPTGLLFEIDWDAVRKTNRCPLCTNKLYESRKFKDSIICRNKKHAFFKIKKWK